MIVDDTIHSPPLLLMRKVAFGTSHCSSVELNTVLAGLRDPPRKVEVSLNAHPDFSLPLATKPVPVTCTSDPPCTGPTAGETVSMVTVAVAICSTLSARITAIPMASAGGRGRGRIWADRDGDQIRFQLARCRTASAEV